jgi:hypothetical protein
MLFTSLPQVQSDPKMPEDHNCETTPDRKYLTLENTEYFTKEVKKSVDS